MIWCHPTVAVAEYVCKMWMNVSGFRLYYVRRGWWCRGGWSEYINVGCLVVVVFDDSPKRMRFPPLGWIVIVMVVVAVAVVEIVRIHMVYWDLPHDGDWHA